MSTNLDRTAVRASKSVTQDWQSLPRMARPRHLLTAGTLPAGTLPAAPTELNVVTLNATDQRQRGGIKSLDLNEDGTRIVTGAADGAAVMWDATTGAVIRDLDMKEEYYHNRSRLFEEGHKFNISKLDFVGPNQSLCLSTSFDGSLCLWQADQSAGDFGTEKCRLTHLRLFNAFGASPDGTFVVTSAALPPTSESISKQNQHPCVQWDIAQLITGETPTPVTTFSGFHKDFVTTVAVSADNLVVATGAKDGYVAFWEPGTGRQLGNVRAHTDKTLVTNIVWVDESSFISTGVDGQIRLWSITRDPSSGLIEANEVLGYAGNTKSPVDSIALSPNRHQFLTIHANFVKEQGKSDTQYSVSLWNISEKRKVRNLQLVASGNSANAENLVSSVAWSTDGNQVAMVSGGQIILYDTSDWSVARVLRRSIRSDVTADQETADVASARFATLGTTELLATFDGNATQLWDLNSPTKESSQLVTTFRPQQSVSVSSLSKDPKHAFLATGSRGLRIFDADERSSSYGQTMCKKDSPHRGYVSALEFSGETDLIASGGTDGGIVFWNWNPTARKLTELGNANFGIGAIVDVKWSADSRSVLVVGQKSAKLLSRPADNSFDIQRWGSTDLHISAAAEDTVKLTCGDISTDGGSISIALAGKFENTDGSVGYVLTKDPGAETFGDPLTFSGHGAGGISAVEFFDGEYVAGARYLVSTGIDGAAIIWNWTSGTPYQAYRFLTPGLPGAAHLAAITDLAVSRSGHIATCSDDGTAIIWRSPFSVTEVGVQPN